MKSFRSFITEARQSVAVNHIKRMKEAQKLHPPGSDLHHEIQRQIDIKQNQLHYAEHGKHKGHPLQCPYCEKRTRHFEHQGMTTSDAQGAAEAEHSHAPGQRNAGK